jgi:hypothetical protein
LYVCWVVLIVTVVWQVQVSTCGIPSFFLFSLSLSTLLSVDKTRQLTIRDPIRFMHGWMMDRVRLRNETWTGVKFEEAIYELRAYVAISRGGGTYD